MTAFLEEKESFAVNSAGTLTGTAKNTEEGDNAYGKRKTGGRISSQRKDLLYHETSDNKTYNIFN